MTTETDLPPHEPQGLYDNEVWVSLSYLGVVFTELEEETILGWSELLVNHNRAVVERIKKRAADAAEAP